MYSAKLHPAHRPSFRVHMKGLTARLHLHHVILSLWSDKIHAYTLDTIKLILYSADLDQPYPTTS